MSSIPANDLSNQEGDKLQKTSVSLGVGDQIPNVTTTNSTSLPGLSQLQEVFELGTGLLLPYAFQPLKAIETYLPGLASMWPFDITSSFNPSKDIPDLSGKVILVTGGNNGLGKETILQLAKHNPHKIFMASRTESKARDAIASIKSQISQDVDIEYLQLDLASLPSIKKAADQVTTRTDRLDILVLNAGIMAVPSAKTAAGQEIQLGTNHVGHFLLTKLLLPTLDHTAKKNSPDVRIISLSSAAWQMAPNIDTIVSTEKLLAQKPWTCYGASKAANVMFAAELARRYPQFTSVSLHPGMIKTDLYTPNLEVNPLVRYGSLLMGGLIFQTIEAGALNQLWLAAGARKEEIKNGQFYTPVGKVNNNKWATDAKDGKRLWEWTEQELKNAGY
ncbi:short-chain dehydrogenase/reductase [Exophiala viscosa]|uniref:Short-chain dehydrogenase/reductase n=1 Tax=Exophiala viscosa TaxID=2486360 RepID=A0AAN6E607_9EURO|nr:short-chain dehydrogenase/reductase [Exophiala viscosa]